MKTNIKKLAHTILLISILFLGMFTVGAQIASAQTSNNYTVLTPLPGTTVENNGNCTGPNCTATLSTYLPGIFNLSIGIAAILAFVLLTIYGFEYMTKDSLSAKMGAKEKLTDVAWGAGIIIFAWLILNTVNPALVSGGLNLTTPQINAPPSVTAGGTTTPNPCNTSGSSCSNEDAAEATLQSNGNILINGQTNYQCTSSFCPTQVAGLTPTTLTDITTLQAQCSCTLNITGGSEAHGTTNSGTDPHAAGTAVDIAESPSLDDDLNTLSPTDCQQVPISNSQGQQIGTALYEKPSSLGGSGCGGPPPTGTSSHWHVQFNQ